MSDKRKKTTARRSFEKKDGAKKARFNSVDVFLIVVLVLCILGIGFRDTIADFINKDDPYVDVELHVFAQDLTPAELTQIKVGNEMLVDGQLFGTVTDIEPAPAKKVVSTTDENGVTTWTEATDPEHYSVTIKVTVAGRYTDNGLYIGDNMDLYVGKILNIYTASYSLTVTITEIPRI